jgi:anti-sigma regulatory factor (Ser/Thr protein kinase)
MDVEPFRETRALSADCDTVARARHFVVDAVRAAAWDEDGVGAVALLTTELVTNAVLHTSSPSSVTIDLTDGGVRVDVVDESSVQPVARSSNRDHDEGGRGLFFLEVMADAWGVDNWSGGKSVWFELHR